MIKKRAYAHANDADFSKKPIKPYSFFLQLYATALDAILSLATDPCPAVEYAGTAALRAAGLEIAMEKAVGGSSAQGLTHYQGGQGTSESMPTKRMSSRWSLLGTSSGRSSSPISSPGLASMKVIVFRLVSAWNLSTICTNFRLFMSPDESDRGAEAQGRGVHASR